MFYYKTRKQYIKLHCSKIMQNVSKMFAESSIRPRDRQQPGMTDHMLVTPGPIQLLEYQRGGECLFVLT